MRAEMTMRRVPDDRGNARYLIADAIQHPPVDAFDRRGDPRKPRGMHHDLLRKIRVDLHGSSRSSAPAVATPTTVRSRSGRYS
jgi:hypothetical protein